MAKLPVSRHEALKNAKYSNRNTRTLFWKAEGFGSAYGDALGEGGVGLGIALKIPGTPPRF